MRLKSGLIQRYLKCSMLLLLFASLAFPQTAKGKSNPASPSLSEGVYLGTEEIKVLETDPHLAVFSLTTSWIPGAAHKGYFRYRMNVYGKGVVLKDAPTYIDKIHACSYTLNLFDKGQFVLLRVPLVFSRVVADNGDVTAMNTNDLVQMDLADYKNFLAGSNWQISWSC